MVPRVSVVIPTHGREGFLVEALHSVSQQTLPPHEIIVVDDLGRAETRDVVGAFVQECLPVRYATNSRRGASASRNVGARLSCGDVIAFLDDDDTWDTALLESAVGVMTAHRADYVLTWFVHRIGDACIPGKEIPDLLRAEDLAVRNPGVMGSNILITKAAFERLSGFDENLCVSEDKDFMIRAIRLRLKGAVLRQRYVYHRIHHEKSLSRDAAQLFRGRLAFFSKHRAGFQLGVQLRMLSRLVRGWFQSKMAERREGTAGGIGDGIEP